MRRFAVFAGIVISAAGILGFTAPADASGTLGASFGTGTPGFAIYAAPSALPNSNNAGEPSIGVDLHTNPAGHGTVMYQAFESTYRVVFNDASTPASVSWSDTAAPNVVNLDPILATDRASGRTFAGGLALPCGQLAYTDNDGTSWTPTLPCSIAIDHETIGSGPFAAGSLPHTFGSDVFYCAQSGVQSGHIGDMCATSITGGATWNPPVPAGCGGLHGHIKVSADGTAYLPNKDCDLAVGHVGGSVSTDNGLLWASFDTGQPSPARGFDPSIATTPDNTVYEAWARAGDYHPVVASSTDHGAHWSAPTDLAATVPGLQVSTFQAAVAGDNGRVAVAYLASSVPVPAGLTPFDNGYHGVWYLYVSYTFDGGVTWTTVNATPGDPVQRGCIWDKGGSNACRNLLDFIDASVTADGRVIVAFADGCITACAAPAGTEAESTSAYATIARQSTGEGLYASF